MTSLKLTDVMSIVAPQILFGLLSCDHWELGLEELSIPGWTVSDILGHGRFASVHRAKRHDMKDEVVLKVFAGSDDSVRNAEYDALIALAKNGVRNVPVVLDRFDARSVGGKEYFFLAVSPIGLTILPIVGGKHTHGGHWVVLVNVLQRAHEMDIAHRDVKPDNIFLHDNDVLLNDWGSSCKIGKRVPFVGTLAYCVEPPGEDGCHVPSASSDLRSLVRSVYSMLTMQFPPEEPEEIATFWQMRLRKDTLWQDLIQFANDANYIALKSALARLL